MRRLKTYTRSTMISERLDGTAFMHVHRETVPDMEKVIDLFAVTNRRLNSTFIGFNQYIVFDLKIIFATITSCFSVIYQDSYI